MAAPFSRATAEPFYRSGMNTQRRIEPRLRPGAQDGRTWGLYCEADNRWLPASFATRQAAAEAVVVLERSGGG